MNFKAHLIVLFIVWFSAFAEEDAESYEEPNKTGQLPKYPVCVHFLLKPMCISYYRPVCGSDGRTYRNKCELCSYYRQRNEDIKIVKTGRC